MLECPECGVEFESDVNTSSYYIIECPACDMWEIGENNHIQNFIVKGVTKE